MDRQTCVIWMMMRMEENYIREQQNPDASHDTIEKWRDDMFMACLQTGKLCGFTKQQSLDIFSAAADLWIDKHMTGDSLQETLSGLYGDEAAELHPEIFGGAS